MTGNGPPAPPAFPFSAVVDHEEAKLALLLAALEPAIGGVLLRGQKGSAKTTLARGLVALLPSGGPFVELPLGATEDRVIGALDLEEALTGGHRRFRPGLLKSAHGGVLYVDEINLLPDHLVDVLLDVAVSGINRVERDGLSETHPSRFVLIGSMNPEEGDLRPQLLDRFGLAVEILSDPVAESRAEAVRRRLAFESDPALFLSEWADDEYGLAERLAATRRASLPPELVEEVSALCAAVGAEGLRGDLVICRAAAALAGWEGRERADRDDVRRVAALALGHRRRRGPFDQAGIGSDEIDQALDDVARSRSSSASAPAPGADAVDTVSGLPDPPPRDPAPAPGAGQDVGSADRDPAPAPDAPPAVPGPPATARLGRDRSRSGGTSVSDSSSAPTGRSLAALGPRGRLIGDRPPGGPVRSLALGATVQRSALRRALDPGSQPGPTLVRSDLREAVREDRDSRLVVVAVDASGSMGVQNRMEAVKGAVLGLLLDAYQQRDRVALVTFRGDEARVALRPTGSVEVGRARLIELPTGGRTPLARGIALALEVATSASSHRAVIVLVSDGRATGAPGDGDPLEAALAAAAEVRRRSIQAVVIDAEDGPVRLGLATQLAEAMGARLVFLPDWSAGPVAEVLRSL